MILFEVNFDGYMTSAIKREKSNAGFVWTHAREASQASAVLIQLLKLCQKLMQRFERKPDRVARSSKTRGSYFN